MKGSGPLLAKPGKPWGFQGYISQVSFCGFCWIPGTFQVRAHTCSIFTSYFSIRDLGWWRRGKRILKNWSRLFYGSDPYIRSITWGAVLSQSGHMRLSWMLESEIGMLEVPYWPFWAEIKLRYNSKCMEKKKCWLWALYTVSTEWCHLLPLVWNKWLHLVQRHHCHHHCLGSTDPRSPRIESLWSRVRGIYPRRLLELTNSSEGSSGRQIRGFGSEIALDPRKQGKHYGRAFKDVDMGLPITVPM